MSASAAQDFDRLACGGLLASTVASIAQLADPLLYRPPRPGALKSTFGIECISAAERELRCIFPVLARDL